MSRHHAGLNPYALRLRLDMTDAERALWRGLRESFPEERFRRQVCLGAYIVDFAHLQKSLVIEVDGGQHDQNEQDRIRDAWLVEQGFRVLRFWNPDVLRNPKGVLEIVRENLLAGERF